MDKQAFRQHQQRVINNLNHKLFQIECRIKEGPTGYELQLLEERRVKIEVRLMQLYYTEQYGLVHR